MKLMLAFQCICLIIASTMAAIPLPQPGDSQSDLSENCQLPKCPKALKSQQQIHLPYPLDCFQYIECTGSEARVVACPHNHVFDKNTFVCGPPHKVHCVPCYQQVP